MESSMVNLNNEIIKDYFSKHLPMFKLEQESSHCPYWEISFGFNNVKVKIFGDIGFEITIFLFGSQYSLWQFDRNVNNAMNTTKENILYQLTILKSFLDNIDNVKHL